MATSNDGVNTMDNIVSKEPGKMEIQALSHDAETEFKHEPYKKMKKAPPQVKPFDGIKTPAIVITPSGRRSSRRSSGSSLTTICETTDGTDVTHLDEVRTLTEKLHLKGCICSQDFIPSETKNQRIGHALTWLRQELSQMKEQDEELARTLVKLRRELHKLKLERCSAEHRALLEDAIDAEQELHEPSCRISDSIPEALSPTLRNYGLTRMNITARRFSVF
ncbi:hypothetical protein CAPTEDRAFT_223646 [Capitella teleta]|uniref:Uncharacterized protein n=1 Tax=Capitella teleta TaxID=283909 RepID=R7UWX1_CAPTE|nr:hypothetical protein CAPTEDRAFT_223646 [Capitella teleta]|eukprot:ELU10829.1 hypothetical protein CAPTEDRAFT_223646 [Capitella teleta]